MKILGILWYYVAPGLWGLISYYYAIRMVAWNLGWASWPEIDGYQMFSLAIMSGLACVNIIAEKSEKALCGQGLR